MLGTVSLPSLTLTPQGKSRAKCRALESQFWILASES